MGKRGGESSGLGSGLRPSGSGCGLCGGAPASGSGSGAHAGGHAPMDEDAAGPGSRASAPPSAALPATSWARLMSTSGTSPVELARALAALGAVPFPSPHGPHAASFRRPSRALLLEALELCALTCQGEGLDPRGADVAALAGALREAGYGAALARGCLAQLSGRGVQVEPWGGGEGAAGGGADGDETAGGDADPQGKGAPSAQTRVAPLLPDREARSALYVWSARAPPSASPGSLPGSASPAPPSASPGPSPGSSPAPPSASPLPPLPSVHPHAHFPAPPVLALPRRADLAGPAARLLVADSLLDARAEWPCLAFLDEWARRLERVAPGAAAPTIEELRGRAIAVVPRAGKRGAAGGPAHEGLETVVEAPSPGAAIPLAAIPPAALVLRLRTEELPSDPRKRFQALFGAKALWLADDLAPYVADAAAPGQTLEALLLRHARAVQPDLAKPPMYALRR